MKALFYTATVLSLVLMACSKSTTHSSLPSGAIGSWLLLEKHQFTGPSNDVIKPQRDSAVQLMLNSDHTFSTRLNNTVVSQGTYSVTRGSVSQYWDGTLELQSFKTTGIFNLFYVYEVGTGGRVLSVYDGMSMKVSHDSLTLAGPVAPGGSISYVFVKE